MIARYDLQPPKVWLSRIRCFIGHFNKDRCDFKTLSDSPQPKCGRHRSSTSRSFVIHPGIVDQSPDMSGISILQFFGQYISRKILITDGSRETQNCRPTNRSAAGIRRCWIRASVIHGRAHFYTRRIAVEDQSAAHEPRSRAMSRRAGQPERCVGSLG